MTGVTIVWWRSVVGWVPRVGVGVDLVAAADVLDLVAAVVLLEPDVRDAAPLGVPDLLAELLRARGDLGGDAATAQPVGQLVGGRAGVLVGERHEHGARDGAAAGEHAVGDERDEGARDAEGDADAGVRRPAVAGQGVVASAAAHGLQPLVARHEDLHDGARVVVEAAGDPEVGLDGDVVVHHVRAAVDDRGQLGQAGLEQLVLDAEAADGLDEGRVGDADGRQGQARVGLLGRGPRRLDQERGDGLGRLLVELVDGADGGGYVGDAQAAVEALDQLAVVDLEREGGQRAGRRGPPPSRARPRRRGGRAARRGRRCRCRPG